MTYTNLLLCRHRTSFRLGLLLSKSSRRTATRWIRRRYRRYERGKLILASTLKWGMTSAIRGISNYLILKVKEYELLLTPHLLMPYISREYQKNPIKKQIIEPDTDDEDIKSH